MNEHGLRRKCSAFLKGRDGWNLKKISDRFHSGVLDYIGHYEGLYVTIELKVKPNKLTKLQRYSATVDRQKFGLVFVVYTFEEFKKCIETIERLHCGPINRKLLSFAERMTPLDC